MKKQNLEFRQTSQDISESQNEESIPQIFTSKLLQKQQINFDHFLPTFHSFWRKTNTTVRRSMSKGFVSTQFHPNPSSPALISIISRVHPACLADSSRRAMLSKLCCRAQQNSKLYNFVHPLPLPRMHACSHSKKISIPGRDRTGLDCIIFCLHGALWFDEEFM